jgi:hypothetical protein
MMKFFGHIMKRKKTLKKKFNQVSFIDLKRKILVKCSMYKTTITLFISLARNSNKTQFIYFSTY